jgi:multiple sugar transport system substrate-binding protein
MFRKKTLILLFLLSVILVSCLNTTSQSTIQSTPIPASENLASDTLNIWWNKGYYPEEELAFQEVIDRWQKQTNKKINLTFITDANIIQRKLSVTKDYQIFFSLI